MRFVAALGTFMTAAMLAAPAAEARTGEWCAIRTGMTCGYVSFQQCLDAASGLGAICKPDIYPDDQPVRRQARRH
jgi:Protein of unknown function (DUF3551)